MTRYSVMLITALGVLLAVSGCGGKGGRVGTTPEPQMAPEIKDVSPLSIDEGENRVMRSEVYGSSPMTYHWNFGGGGEPDESTERSPRVSFLKTGIYSASLSVTNPYGEDVLSFELIVGDNYPKLVNVNVSRGTAQGAVSISWEVNPEYATPLGFRIKSRTRTNASYELIAGLGPEAREFVDSQPPGLVVSYVIEAWNDYGSEDDHTYHQSELEYYTGWAASPQATICSEKPFDGEIEAAVWLDKYPAVLTLIESVESDEPVPVDFHVNGRSDGLGEWFKTTVLVIQSTRYDDEAFSIVDADGFPVLLALATELNDDEENLWVGWASAPLDIESWQAVKVTQEEDPRPYSHSELQVITECGRVFALWETEYPELTALSYSSLPPSESSWTTTAVAEWSTSGVLGSQQGEIFVVLPGYGYQPYFGRAPADQDVVSLTFIESWGIPSSGKFLEVDDSLALAPIADNISYYSSSDRLHVYLPVDVPTYSVWETKELTCAPGPRFVTTWRGCVVCITSSTSRGIFDGHIKETTKWGFNVFPEPSDEGPAYYIPLREGDLSSFKAASIQGDYLLLATGERDEQNLFTIYDLSGISMPEL